MDIGIFPTNLKLEIILLRSQMKCSKFSSNIELGPTLGVTMESHISKLTKKILKSYGQERETVQHFDNSPLPYKNQIYEILEDCFVLLFPGYFGISELSFESIELQLGYTVARIFEKLKTQINRETQHSCKFNNRPCKHCSEYGAQAAEKFLSEIPELRKKLELDVLAAFENDPAASGFDEIIFSYPGLEAVAVYRIANIFSKMGLVLIPRIMTEWAHFRTGIDIHPKAQIGESFFIDHGTGVVIGETSVIGNRVTLYQGVTLGALNFPRDQKGKIIRGAKRHPTIEDDSVIYAGATILGGNTVIGRGSVIGGNVWLTESVPPYSRVVLGKNDLKISSRRKPDKK